MEPAYDVFTMGKTFLRLCVLCLLACGILAAQLTRGFISGTIQDASGAVIAGVNVRATNKATNVSSETESNSLGVYRIVGVEPGLYSIEFSKPGFDKRRLENVQVSTGQEVTVNQSLPVATAATSIDVQDAPPGIELAKSNATIERTLPQVFIQNIPLTGERNVNTLALLAPHRGARAWSTGISVNGSRARNNNFMVDGVDNNDASVTLTASRVLPEQISEYQIQTSPYSAEFGRNTGGQINVITRSGSNEVHGEAWDYYRGNWMEPVSLLNKRAGLDHTPRFVQNQAGGDIGAPIIRNRTFIFGLYEANIRREAPDARNASSFTIPTPAGYALLPTVPLRAASGNVPAQSPQSRQAVLDTLKFLPDVYAALGSPLTPAASQTINGVSIPFGTGRIPLANPHDYYYYVIRADHNLNAANRLTYRAQLDKQTDPTIISNLQFGPRWAGDQTNFSQNHALSLSSTIGARFVNEGRFSFVRRNLDFPENDPKSPTVGIGSFTVGGSSNFPQGRIQNTFQYQDVATVMLGRHSLKMGADLRRIRLFNRSGFDSKGTWTFNTLADFLNNSAFNLRQAVNEATFDARQLVQYYFFQDDFKATKDLTLNIGLRYEYQNIPFGFYGAATEQIAATAVPRNVKPDKNNWAPRAGFAYSPSSPKGPLARILGEGKTVVRGGYGIGYDVLFYNILTVTASNYPRVVNSDTFQPATIDLYPVLAPRIAVIPPYDPLTNSFVNANADMQNPTSHYYSLSVQRELGSGNVFELGYTGSRGYHGIRQGQLNPALLTPAQAAIVIANGSTTGIPGTQARRLNPAWGSRTTIESTAKSLYNAGFARFERRFNKGLLFGATYTYSSLFSDNDESLGVGSITNSSPQVPQDYFDYRNEWSRSVFDRPQRLVLNYLYQIPGEKKFTNPFAKRVLGGWEVAGFTEFQSGQPFTIRTGVDSIGQGTTAASRPNYNPSGIFIKDPVDGNLRTFTIPINGTGIVVTPLTTAGLPVGSSMPKGGNLGRNTFRGPGLQNWNFSLSKTTLITERVKLQLRSDWINGFNHRNFGNPVATMTSATFGQNTSDPGGRTMLLNAKIIF
jgi:Outer membrane receptor proteins, mostly Fe transport